MRYPTGAVTRTNSNAEANVSICDLVLKERPIF